MLDKPTQRFLNLSYHIAKGKVQAKQTLDSLQRRLILRSIIGLPIHQRKYGFMKSILRKSSLLADRRFIDSDKGLGFV
jgi:hypothetical protein